MTISAKTAALSPADLPLGEKVLAFSIMCIGFFIALLDIQIVSPRCKTLAAGFRRPR